MSNSDTTPATAPNPLQRQKRDRLGLAVSGPDSAAVISTIVAAEAAGVPQIWMTQSTPLPDTLTIFAAAAVQTSSVRMGTSIVPTYPRNPLALAQQALVLGDLAPGRLQLGIGPSHRPVIEGMYGIPLTSPQNHLREYVAVLRALLWEGNVDFHGRFFTIKSTLPRTPRTPILVSALREGAFHLAGEISDGVISWMCPPNFLLEKALPALHAGAAKSGRAAPRLIAHVPVALSQDHQAIVAAARKQVGHYGHLLFYVNMFADAGFPVPPDGTLPEALIDNLVVSGDDAIVAARLTDLLASGLDELLIFPIGVTDLADERNRLMRLIGQF